MAFATLFTLLDDITAVMDDVALMTKVAAKKTAGVVGDDLALNADQVIGVNADRELPIIWKVAVGSLINKLILIPVALLLSWLAPWLITPLLILGGTYLCFEGVEKLLHPLLHKDEEPHAPASDEPTPDELEEEEDKITGAIRTDFILSAEIIIIALGVVGDYPLLSRSVVMAAIGVGMTVFVYGLVAIIVKLDDLGLWMMKKGGLSHTIGQFLITVMPWFMRSLSVLGTVAMFLVGGGIIAHGLPFVSHFLHENHWESGLMGNLASLVVGLSAGAIACAVVLPLLALFSKKEAH